MNWEVGQYVAVITSIYKDIEQDQNEVRRIVAVSGKYASSSSLSLPLPHLTSYPLVRSS